MESEGDRRQEIRILWKRRRNQMLPALRRIHHRLRGSTIWMWRRNQMLPAPRSYPNHRQVEPLAYSPVPIVASPNQRARVVYRPLPGFPLDGYQGDHDRVSGGWGG